MDATPLAVTDIGRGAPIVLIHGLTFSGHTWQSIADMLSGRHRVIAVDLPGHGDSGGSAADPGLVVARLHHTLTQLRVEAPVVVGHSAGALAAIGYAANHQVGGVVDVDQPLLVAPFAAMLQQLAPQLRGPNFELAFAAFEQSIGVDRLPASERERVSASRQVRQDLVLDHWHMPMTTAPEQVQATVDGLLDAIDAPFLYVAGEEVPAPIRDHLEAHLQQPRIVTWPSNGHLVHLAEPQRFASLLSAFTASVTG
jgi:pimeloyl-ACP methyl ester carboxylesterase